MLKLTVRPWDHIRFSFELFRKKLKKRPARVFLCVGYLSSKCPHSTLKRLCHNLPKLCYWEGPKVYLELKVWVPKCPGGLENWSKVDLEIKKKTGLVFLICRAPLLKVVPFYFESTFS